MPMRKYVVFLLTGLVLCAASIGFFRTNTYQRVEAASSSKLSYDEEGKITLGSFPLNFNIKQSEDATGERLDDFITGIDGSSSLGVINITTVDGKKYGFIPTGTTINKDGGANVGDAKLPSGVTEIKYATDKSGVFDFADLKWVKYEETDDYIDFISDYIIYRDVFDDGGNGPDYENSTLCNHLNNEFVKIAFSKEDKEYLVQKDIGGSQRYVDIPKLDKVDSGNGEPSCSGPSDIAILNHISSKESYKNAPYWTQDKSGSRVSVRWYNKTATDCLTYDNNIGVRPIIRIKASMIGKSGGGSSSNKEPTSLPPSNPAIGVGIAFGVIGLGALIAFFILWSKKLKEDPKYKAPGWYYAIIFIASACCCISIITFSTQSTPGGGGGGASCFKTGYYVQVGQHSGNGVVQVGYTAWLIKSDGTVSYCSALEDNNSASDFRADNYMSGTYTISGSKLVIEIPKTEIKNFGTVGGTYTYTINGCEEFKNSVDTYKWVRGE